MATRKQTKSSTPTMELSRFLARALNTSNANLLYEFLAENVELTGHQDTDRANGPQEVVDFFNQFLNQTGRFHLPTLAEIATLMIGSDEKLGVVIEVEEIEMFFIYFELDDISKIKSLFIHRNNPDPFYADYLLERPGFNASDYKLKKDCLKEIRHAQIDQLKDQNRPHFLAVLSEDQEPTTMALILKELTSNFSGSTAEIVIDYEYELQHRNSDGNIESFSSPAKKALKKINGKDYPSLGVMLGQLCIRPGSLSWHPESVTSDLIRMGISKSMNIEHNKNIFS